MFFKKATFSSGKVAEVPTCQGRPPLIHHCTCTRNPQSFQKDPNRLKGNTLYPTARETPNTKGTGARGGRQSSELF